MNYVNKRYVKVYEEEILKEQLKGLTENDSLLEIVQEYEERKSKEAKLVKDADLPTYLH